MMVQSLQRLLIKSERGRAMAIYTASKTKHADKWRALRSAGYPIISTWIDEAGRIGSKAKGGPTVYQWLAYFGHRPREIVDVLKALFPELVA